MQGIDTKTIVADFFNQLRLAPASVLLLDYDGTLAPFQTDRERAFPYPGVVGMIENILRCDTARVIVISGRPVREIQNLLGPLPNLEIWGAHALEHLLSDGTYQKTSISPEITHLLREAEQWLVAAKLISLAEIKPGGVAIHWRGLPEAEIDRLQALTQEGWASLAEQPGLKLLRFDGGLELRAAHPDKGDAVKAILRELSPHTQVAFLGDDLTDEDAFRALGTRGLSLLVRSEYRETNANAWLRPPQELMGFLEHWLASVSMQIRTV
jgi:trehalose 6-phosphate phosphatase